MIGIVGGMGPYSGTDLLEKIFDNTIANNDQEYIDTVLLSMGSKVEDRTQYLLGKVKVNPAISIAKLLLKLQSMGVTVAGIPCNTSHSKEIFDVIKFELKKVNSSIKLLNMIDETISFIDSFYPKNIERIGILSTTGTYKSGIYKIPLLSKGYEVIVPPYEMQEKYIHPAIYDPIYGIKSVSNPINKQARKNLMKGIDFFKENNVEVVILGCSEIPLAIKETIINTMQIIDPTNILARALIHNFNSDKLRPFLKEKS